MGSVVERRSLGAMSSAIGRTRWIDDKLIEIIDAYDSDEITRSQVAEISRKQRERREVLEKRLKSLDANPDAGTPEWWAELDLGTRRAVIKDTARVTLKPGGRAGRHGAPVETRIVLEPLN